MFIPTLLYITLKCHSNILSNCTELDKLSSILINLLQQKIILQNFEERER